MHAQGLSAQHYRYTAAQRDAERGLVYLHARMYDPSIERFMGWDRLAGSVGQPLTLDQSPGPWLGSASRRAPEAQNAYNAQNAPPTGG